MLEKPDLDEHAFVAQIERHYGMTISRLEFLPLGADPSAAIYRGVSVDGATYFAKLRRGPFADASVVLPGYLVEHGLGHVIAPIATLRGDLWTRFNPFTLVLYPFVEGQDGYARSLTEAIWLEFGNTLKRLHTLALPPDIKKNIPIEIFDPRWRKQVRGVLVQLETLTLEDAYSREMATFIAEKRSEILELVRQAERLAEVLRRRRLEPVLCHADLHAGNLLITDQPDFYIVDWDAPILAPKERDLMFVGGGLGFRGHTPAEEEQLFYRGYGHTDLDLTALAYYRFERIVQDIAVYGDELVRQSGSDEDRRDSLRYLKSNFGPGGTIERAYAVHLEG